MTCNITTTTTKAVSFMDHLRRLGVGVNSVVSPSTEKLDNITVVVEGWPDPVTYFNLSLALKILLKYPNGHMSTEEGDSEVCHMLEKMGCVLQS